MLSNVIIILTKVNYNEMIHEDLEEWHDEIKEKEDEVKQII